MKDELVEVSKKVEKLTKKFTLDVMKSKDFGKVYSAISQMLTVLGDAKKLADEEMKKVMREEYLKTGNQTVKLDDFDITYVPGTVRSAFDSAAFKKANLELYSKYVKSSTTSDSVRVKVHDKGE